MFGRKEVSTNGAGEHKQSTYKKSDFEDEIYDMIDEIKTWVLKVNDRLSEIEDKINTENEIKEIKEQLRKKDQFIADLLLKVIDGGMHKKEEPKTQLANYLEKRGTTLAGPKGKLPG